jgi:hypothetical protein
LPDVLRQLNLNQGERRAIVCVNPESVLWFSVRLIQGRDPRKVVSKRGAFEAAFAQPRTRATTEADFFIWIRRNSLKRPISAKGIQGNASLFAWIYLVLFAFIWR